MENKPAYLRVVPLGKALGKVTPSSSGGRMAGYLNELVGRFFVMEG